MKLLFKISIVFLITLFVFQFPISVFAQNASSSAQNNDNANQNASSSAEFPINIDEQNISSLLNETPKFPEDISPTVTIKSLIDKDAFDSAFFKVKSKFRVLAKKVYKADEKVDVIVENASSTDLKVTVFDPDGNEAELDSQIISSESPAIIEFTPPIKSFKPGRYRIVVDDGQGNISNQNFSWGVLAINSNKSIYLPNEDVHLSMAVLNEAGYMVCNAALELKITNTELNINETLSTTDKTIKVNDECSIKGFTTVPDYEANYKVSGVGTYELKLSATTENGSFAIDSAFDVRESVPFDLERSTATRIYPAEKYEVNLDITANEDFEGKISEIVPGNFDIEESGVKFSKIEVLGAKDDEAVEDKPIYDISNPFKGEHQISEYFGAQHSDPALEKKYTDFGVIGHDGVDFDMPTGTEVLAVSDGKVVRARENYDYGTTIVLDHEWGKSYYGHLSKLNVEEGHKVKKGEVIGLSGNTGLSSGAHLHFGIKPKNNNKDNGYFGKINPLPYMNLATDDKKNDESPNFNSNGDLKKITWDVNIKKGDKLTLSYKYKAPPVSPQFYEIGPLRFESKNGEIVFREGRRWQIAADAVANSGTIFYSDTTDNDIVNARTYTDPTTIGAEYNTVNPSANNNWVAYVKIIASPTREEKIAIMGQQATGTLFIYKCTSGCDASGDWSELVEYDGVASDGDAQGTQAVDIAYEQITGDLVVVFASNADTGDVYYCKYDGTSWTPTTECSGGTFAPGAGNQIDMEADWSEGDGLTGQPEWIRLVSRGDRLTSNRNNELLLGVSDSNADLFLAHWTGSAWDDQANPVDDLDNTACTDCTRNFDIAWEETTGEGLAVVTDDSTSTNLRYVTYTSGAWGSVQTSGEANNGTQAFGRWPQLASDPLTDDIAIIIGDSGNDTEFFYWDGSTLSDKDATDDTATEASRAQHDQVQWTRFTSEAVFVYADLDLTTMDMQCWQTGGGDFTANVDDIGNPNIAMGDDVEDTTLVASPNNDRMLMTTRAIDTAGTTGDDLRVWTYDGAGCGDADWADVGTAGLHVEGNNAAVTAQKRHGFAYTPYSPWSLNWRFYDDETVDDPSTGLNGAAENVAPTGVDKEEFIRLRFNAAERGGMGQTDTRKILQYTSGCTPDSAGGESSCTWTDVGDTSETSAVWRYATSGETCSACSDGNTSTTSRLTGTDQASPAVFYVSDKDAAADADFDHTALKIREIDFPLKAEAVTASTTYYFRLYEPRISSNGQDSPIWREQDNDGNNDCASATCTYPSLTISADGPSLDQLLRHGAWFSSGVEQPFTF